MRYRQLGELHAVFFRPALAERPSVKADQRGVPEVGIYAVEAGAVGDSHIHIVRPRHRFGHHDLLVLGRIHIALASDDQLGALHRAIAPNFRIVAVVANDQADFHALRPFGHISGVSRIPAFDRAPRNAFAVLLHDFALVVHQDQRVVRRFFRMVLVLLAGQGEHAPNARCSASLRENSGLFAGNRRRCSVHFVVVIHDAHRAVFRKYNQIHARQTLFHADDHIRNFTRVLQNLLLGVQTWNFIVDYRYPYRICAARNVPMSHCKISSHMYGLFDEN